MKLTVFGATGGIGTQVVRQALDAGHEVVAVVRDPARLDVPARPGLTVVRADVMDPEAIGPAVDGADAVVSALGPRPGGPVTVNSDGIRAILQAMDKAGVRRVVVVSAAGAFTEPTDGTVSRLIVKPLLQRILREGMADTRRMEQDVRESTAEWTLVRPPRLTNRAGRGRYRTAIDRHVGTSIARADVAGAILNALGNPATAGHTVGIGN
ncbi:MAG TPA: NAD(P)H-binding protein [Streptosporangiaceae bacterium]|jgi:putative NADH-flavin reductase